MNKPLFVAEVGINHNGDIKIAKRLIDMAVRCGVDLVKFQKRSVDVVYSKEFLDSPRDSPWGSTQREQKEGLEFGLEEYRQIDEYCKKKKIQWFASAWDYDSFVFLRQFDLPYNKIASAMISNYGFLRRVASVRKHTFVSTGLCGWEDVDTAVQVFNMSSCPFTLLHCVGLYPCPDKLLGLGLIELLKNYDVPVGYSGHSPGILDSIVAVVLGAVVVEKHITLDRSMYGSDQASSLEESGLRKTVEGIRFVVDSLGDGKKVFLDEEKLVARKLRYWE
jgi:N-acetylneuraminate synthase